MTLQCVQHLRMKQKVRVSPNGWRTVFDFANAKLEKKNETAKRKVKKKMRDILFTLSSTLSLLISFLHIPL